MSKKTLIRSSLVALLLVALTVLAPAAEAGCEWGHTYRTTYYAWKVPGGLDPDWFSCSYPVISPDLGYSWEPIGEITYNECTDSWDSWGNTTSCTDPANQEEASWRCGLICS